MALHFLLLASMLVIFSQCTNGELQIDKDMDGKVFLFQEASGTNYVTLKPSLTAALTSFTVCVRALTELYGRECSLFSASNPPNKDNDLLLFRSSTDGSQYSIHVGNTEVEFKTSQNNAARNHVCATWESQAGVMQVWINGNPSVKKISAVGYTIQTSEMKIILAQEQDTYGGSFDPNQSYVGEMGDINMWNYVLSSTDIANARDNSRDYFGNVINSRSLTYEITGDVRVL